MHAMRTQPRMSHLASLHASPAIYAQVGFREGCRGFAHLELLAEVHIVIFNMVTQARIAATVYTKKTGVNCMPSARCESQSRHNIFVMGTRARTS